MYIGVQVMILTYSIIGNAFGVSESEENLTESHQGVTLYVSKLGHNSDGTSWSKAFTTIQAALDAVPDENGGHRIVIRPDTYMEGMLAPAFKGTTGAYNEFVEISMGSMVRAPEDMLS